MFTSELTHNFHIRIDNGFLPIIWMKSCPVFLESTSNPNDVDYHPVHDLCIENEYGFVLGHSSRLQHGMAIPILEVLCSSGKIALIEDFQSYNFDIL